MATAYSVNHTGKKNSCNSCYGSNKPDVNWCIHCGTAMIGEKIKHIQAPLKLEPKASLSSTHQCQEYVTTTNTLSSRCSKKQSNIKEPANRYWEMSKCYAWRKPRSNLNKVKYRSASPSDLSKSSDVCTYNSEEKNQHHEGNLQFLPNEILVEILSYLNQPDILSCMLVCRMLYDAARDKSLWRTVTIKKIKNLNKAILWQISLKGPQHLKVIDCQGFLEVCDIVEFFIQLGEHLKSIEIKRSELGPHITDVLLLSAASNCKNLSSISIDWISISEETLTKIIRSCYSLEELSIRYPEVSNSNISSLICTHGHCLRKLDLKSTFITQILTSIGLKKFTSVKSLNSSFDVIDGDIVQRLSSAFPKLKTLYICCTNRSRILMQDAVQEIIKIPLETLYFKISMRDILDTTVCSLLNQLSTLRHLGIDCLDDDQVDVLCQGKLHLETLDLSGSFITDKCFGSIMSGSFYSFLKCFKINYCDGINKAAVQETIRSFSSDWEDTTMAQDITHFIIACQSLRVLEMRGIHCACKLDTHQLKTCVIIQ